ncbi:MAG: CYTH domain-containing protein, partial [Acutalibacteraceae bacterium]
MWEFEKKALLTRAEYEILETAFFGADCKSVVNKNHYYDTDNLEMNRAGITCRIRETDGRFKAVIKTHKTDGGECSREDSFPADGAGNAITVNGRSYNYKGTLITFRKIKKYNEKISLMLDKNEYLGVTDYELEIEYCRGCKSSAEDLLGKISELLKKHGALQSGLPPGERAYSAVSKSSRFFERYKSLQDCGKNINFGKTPKEKESLVKFSTGMNSVQIRSLKDGLGRKILEEMRTENGALFCEFVYRKDSDTDKSSDKTESGFSSQSRRAYQIKYSNGRTLSYEYDENGRVTKFNDGNKNTTVYGYDPQGR